MGNGAKPATPLCCKGGGHGHYVVICPSKGLQFCIEEPTQEPELEQKEEQNHNEKPLEEEYDYFGGMNKSYSLVMRPLLAIPKAK